MSQQPHLSFPAHSKHVVTVLLLLADQDKIITASDDQTIQIHSSTTGELLRTLTGHTGGIWALQQKDNVLVSGSTDSTIKVWDLATGKCVATLRGHTATVRCLEIVPASVPAARAEDTSSEGEWLIVSGSRDSTLRVWTLPRLGQGVGEEGDGLGGECSEGGSEALRTLVGHTASIRDTAACGDTLISGSYDCTVGVWKISTGERVYSLVGHRQKVYSVVLDHERRRCVSGSMDIDVRIWCLETGTCLFTLGGHTSLVGLLQLSHGVLVSAGADGRLIVWDPETGERLKMLSAHTGAVTCLQHDGRKIVSGADRALKLWDIETGECVRDLLTGLNGVWQVKFDGDTCVAAVQRDNVTYIEVMSTCQVSLV